MGLVWFPDKTPRGQERQEDEAGRDSFAAACRAGEAMSELRTVAPHFSPQRFSSLASLAFLAPWRFSGKENTP